MKLKEAIGIALTILFWIQIILIIYLGIRLYMVGRQLEVQKEPVKTPAMVRGRM